MTFDDVIALMKRVANFPPGILDGVSTDDVDECAAWLVDKLVQVQQHYIPRFLAAIAEIECLMHDLDVHIAETKHEPGSVCLAKRALLEQSMKVANERLEAAYALQFAVRSFLLKEEPN